MNFENQIIISAGYSNKEVINNILKLHIPNEQFDLDPTFSTGKFYKGLKIPCCCGDINPQNENIEKMDSTNLFNFADKSIESIMFDPPFCFGGKNGPHGGQGKERVGKQTTEIRFGMFWNFDALKEMYQKSLKEFYRILKKKGILIFKCQDYTDTKTTMTHCFVYNWAVETGFYAKDLAILVMPNKWYVKGRKQKHLRKVHSYFWIFQK